MSRKSSSTAASKNSSAAASQKSSILRSSFAPSHLQLRLFASVIQSFDSQQLRIHDTTNGRLRCQHETRLGSRINCLDWGYYGVAYRDQKQKKKRKRQDRSDGAVVAFGTNASEIFMFSPAEGKVIGTLRGEHESGILDFRFSPSTDYREGWSIGEDAKLVHWDLIRNQALRTINLPETANVLSTPSPNPFQVLCASSMPYALDFDADGQYHLSKYDSFKNDVHSLFRSGIGKSSEDEFFLAADLDRYINIYNLQNRRLVRTLVAGSGVTSADLYDPSEEVAPNLRKQLLGVLTKDGIVELFFQPFDQPEQTGDLKSNRKNLTRKANASIRLVSPDSKTIQIPIFAASVQGSDIVLASADGGVDFSFQKIPWQDERDGTVLFFTTKDVVKIRTASTLNTATLNGVKDLGKSHVDESKTVVVNGGGQPPTIELSSDESEDEVEEEDDDDEGERDEQPSTAANNHTLEDEDSAEDETSDQEMAEAHEDNPAVKEPDHGEMQYSEEPTFGELLTSRHPAEISISSALLPDPSTTALTIKNGQPVIPSGMSLGTVLTQSLRTNDQNLLEACLHTLDVNIVKNTIQRLDSSLAGILLGKLAERLASRPGRYGNLITWVQWTCIAHGGAIAAQPDVTAKVRTLYQVLGQRAKSLDNLLLLKGKLDMLDAQLAYRKQLAAQQHARADQDTPGMIYIEGEDDENWESDDADEEDLGEEVGRPSKRARARGRKDLDDLISMDEEDAEDEDQDAIGLENGVDESDEDLDDEDEGEDEGVGINGRLNGLVDIEADVSSADESDPDDVGNADQVEDEESEEEATSDDEEDEEDENSEMDSFINDESIEIESGPDDVHVEGDSEPELAEPEPVSKAKIKGKSPKKRQKMIKVDCEAVVL